MKEDSKRTRERRDICSILVGDLQGKRPDGNQTQRIARC
jgi:hypothetical protein